MEQTFQSILEYLEALKEEFLPDKHPELEKQIKNVKACLHEIRKAKVVIKTRDEDGNWYYAGGECWSSCKDLATSYATVEEAQAMIKALGKGRIVPAVHPSKFEGISA